MQIKHILFPFDFSPRCGRAVPRIAAIASRFNAKITILTAAERDRSISMEDAAPLVLIDEWRILRHLERELDNASFPNFSSLRIERVADLGEPAQVITHFAHTYGVDLIMMPTHGHGTFRRFLLGSVTAKVLHDAQCPVWTDAHAEQSSSIALPGVSKILCSVDTDSRDVPVIHWAAEFAREWGAEVRLVHAIPAAISAEALANRSHWKQVFQSAHENMSRFQQEAGVTLETTFRGGSSEEAVHDVALRDAADLVVIGRGDLQEPFGRLRSHTYAIVRESPCPVISV